MPAKSGTSVFHATAPTGVPAFAGMAWWDWRGWLCPRQIDHGPHPWRIVLDPERAAMQPCHGIHQGKPKTRARFGAAFFQAHEAFQHAFAIGFGDAGAVVGDFDQRSEERRVGKECGSPVRYRWGPD